MLRSKTGSRVETSQRKQDRLKRSCETPRDSPHRQWHPSNITRKMTENLSVKLGGFVNGSIQALGLLSELPLYSLHLAKNIASTLYKRRSHEANSKLQMPHTKDASLAGRDVSGYDEMSLADLISERYERSKLPFQPPNSWSVPYSIAIAAVRSFCHNGLGLNGVRALTKFTLDIGVASGTRVFVLSSYFASDENLFLHMVYGINVPARFDDVGPEGQCSSSAAYKPTLHVPSLSALRFHVHIDGEGHPDYIDAEWVVDPQVIASTRSLVTRTLAGPELVDCADRFLKLCETRASRRSKWWRNEQVLEAMKSTSLNSKLPFGKALNEIVVAFHAYKSVYRSTTSLEAVKAVLKQEKVVLYFHGGGYCSMSTRTHRAMTWRTSRETGARVLALNYRRCPEFGFPAAVVDATSAYLQLINAKSDIPLASSLIDDDMIHPAVIAGVSPFLPYSPDNIIVAGDSAGGGLVMSLLVHLRDSGYPVPRCAITISPWLDISCSLPSWNYNHHFDYLPRLDLRDPENIISAYTGWKSERMFDPVASTVFADVSHGLPSILIQVGECEYLLNDALVMTQKMQVNQTSDSPLSRGLKQNGKFRLEVYEGMVHVWHFIPFVPNADMAFRRIARFVEEVFADRVDAELAQTTLDDDNIENAAFESTFIKRESISQPVSTTVEQVFVTNDHQVLPIEGQLNLYGRFKHDESTALMDGII